MKKIVLWSMAFAVLSPSMSYATLAFQLSDVGGFAAFTASGSGTWSNPGGFDALVNDTTLPANWWTDPTVVGFSTATGGSFDFGGGVTTTAVGNQFIVGNAPSNSDAFALELSMAPVDGAAFSASGTIVFDRPFSEFDFSGGPFSFAADLTQSADPGPFDVVGVPEPSSCALLGFVACVGITCRWKEIVGFLRRQLSQV